MRYLIVEKLTPFIEANRNKPFEWGSHDCGLWAAAACLELFGHDPASDIRGHYTTAAGAVRAMKKYAGVTTPEAFAEARLGPSKPVALALPGDIVAADLKALGLAGDERQIGLSLGVCNGAVSFFVSETGLVEIQTLSSGMAFNGQGR